MADWSIQFLRPWWLLGVLPWLLLLLWAWQKERAQGGWEDVVDPALQPYVIDNAKRHKSKAFISLFLGWLLSLLILSGPVWEKQDMPVFKEDNSQVVLFDLSQSMLSSDIKPSRLTRARYKLSDLLTQSEGMQIALIAFSERPYVISPLSDDAKTILAFVDSLRPEIMPVQGSRIDFAIDKGMELLTQAGVGNGQLLLITDSDASARDLSAAQAAKLAGHQLLVLGVGTERGEPLRGENGHFIKDANGAIVVPQLDVAALRSLAKMGGGQFFEMTTDDTDISQIRAEQEKLEMQKDEQDQEQSNEAWVEYAPFAVLLILLASLGFFRRGIVW